MLVDRLRQLPSAVLATVAVVLLAAYYGWRITDSTGVYNDDDLGHYFVAKDCLTDPRLFLDVWGRPLFNLLYAVPAGTFGFRGVQVTTLVVSLAAVLTTGLAARAMRLNGWLAGGLLATMPFFVLLSGSSLTEPLAALAVAVALLFWVQRRWTAFAAVAALVPLARLELLLLVAVWAVALCRRRAFGPAVLLGWGMATWAIIGGLVYGDPLWLLQRVAPGGENLYGSTSFWHYPRGLVFIIGPVAFLFLLVDATVGVVRRRVDLLLVSAVVALAIYLVFSWKLSVGHAAGFLRHVVAVTPIYAIVAARGVSIAGQARHRRLVLGACIVVLGLIALFLSRALVGHHIVAGPFEWTRIAVAAVVVWLLTTAPRPLRRGWMPAVLVGLAFLYTVVHEPPLQASDEQNAVARCFLAYRASPQWGGPVVATHPWMEFYLDGENRRPPLGTPRVDRPTVEAAAPGTVIFWDAHYSPRAPEPMSLRDFKFDPAQRFERVFESVSFDSTFTMVAILKR